MQVLGSCPKYSLPRPAPSVLASLGVGEAGRLWLGRFSRSARFLRLSGRTCGSTVVPSYGHWVSPHSKNKNTGHRVSGRWRAAQNRGALASGIPAQVFCRVQPKPCSEAQELPSQRYGTISNLSAPCKKRKTRPQPPGGFLPQRSPFSHSAPAIRDQSPQLSASRPPHLCLCRAFHTERAPSSPRRCRPAAC